MRQNYHSYPTQTHNTHRESEREREREREFSTFEVLEVAWNAGDGDDPHVVRLRAAIDNLKEAEDLPLAPW